MKKSDKSLHNICIAAIRRHTMQPYDFKWTRFYSSNEEFTNSYPTTDLLLADSELIICSTIIDADNFSVLTTRNLVTNEKGLISSGELEGAVDKLYGDFKGNRDDPFTLGALRLKSGEDLKYYIETGKASMVMIYGVRTMLRTQGMTGKQVDKVAEIWKRKIDE